MSSLPPLLRLPERVWLIIVADCRRTVASSTAAVVVDVVVVAAAATTTLWDRGCFARPSPSIPKHKVQTCEKNQNSEFLTTNHLNA